MGVDVRATIADLNDVNPRPHSDPKRECRGHMAVACCETCRANALVSQESGGAQRFEKVAAASRAGLMIRAERRRDVVGHRHRCQTSRRRAVCTSTYAIRHHQDRSEPAPAEGESAIGWETG